MSRGRRSDLVALILSLVPGWGHVYWGREKLGLVIFTVFALLAFLFLNSLLVSMGSWNSPVMGLAAGLAALIFAGAFVDLWRRTRPARVAAEAGWREKHLCDGMVAYLRGDLESACDCYRRCLELEPQDVEAFFRLAVVCRRQGDVRQAAFWLRRVQKFDLEGKWDWEVKCELRHLNDLGEPGERKKRGEVKKVRVARPRREKSKQVFL